VESVTAAEEARIREACAEDLVGACTEGLLAQPDSAPSEESAKEWWPNPGEDALGEFTHVTVSYRGVPAVVDVSFPVPHGAIVALIGPSGSGKSSLIRCMNRLNDLVPGAEVEGKVLYRAADLYAPGVDAVEVRKRIGMVFQRPSPFRRPSTTTSPSAHEYSGLRATSTGGSRGAATRGALGRGDGPPEHERIQPLGRSATAPRDRSLSGRRSERAADGRAGLGPGPDQHGPYRGPDARARTRGDDS
jgi:ABC transporter